MDKLTRQLREMDKLARRLGKRFDACHNALFDIEMEYYRAGEVVALELAVAVGKALTTLEGYFADELLVSDDRRELRQVAVKLQEKFGEQIDVD